MNLKSTLLLASLTASALPAGAQAEEDSPPGLEALDRMRDGSSRRNPVKNRFFLKSKRFEVTPMFGIVPNNPFARRFTVSLGFGYHFTEQLSVQGMFSFAPDLGDRDLKGLTDVLLQRATDEDFQQPLDKVSLSAAFGVSWSPFYGKINILGETVVNFDFYLFGGLGMVVQTEYLATENPEATTVSEFVQLERGANEVRVAPTIGLGGNFFVTQSIAIRLDGRFALYPDDKPVYDVDNPPEGFRLVSMFTASAGVSIFFPKMKPRLYDF